MINTTILNLKVFSNLLKLKTLYIALLLLMVALAAYFYAALNQSLAEIDRAIIAGDEAGWMRRWIVHI